MLLAERDLPAIGKYIRGLGKAEVTELGIQLGLSFRWLRNIKFSGTHYYDVVDAWLKRQDSVAEICPPTWQNLVATLREVDQNGIADKVTKEQGKHVMLVSFLHPKLGIYVFTQCNRTGQRTLCICKLTAPRRA